MKLRDVVRQITPAGRVLGIVFVVIGIIVLLLAVAANSDASTIGASTDPALVQKYNDLTHQRDLYIILGISAFFLGAFSLTIMAERSISPAPSEAEMISQARVASQILAGLSLAGNAAYIPKRGALTSERIFIPATRDKLRLPSSLTDDLVFSPGKDGSTPGALLSPAGIDLLAAVEKEIGRSVAGIGLEALEAELQMLRFGFGIMKDFHIKERDGKIVYRVEYSGLARACKTVREELPDTCRQMSCFGCACVLAGIARATGKAIRIESVDNARDRVVFQLEQI